MKSIIVISMAICTMACTQSSDPKPLGNPPVTPDKPAQEAQAAPMDKAVIGKPAPMFSLPDLDGKEVKLADFKGKTIVLEWFNPECPFVQLSHRKGGLVDTAARHTGKGVVWLAINSGAPGKQGHGKDTNLKGKSDFNMSHPILLDENGAVGKMYGAKHTPHMFIIDAKGVLVYAGAIDSTEGGEPEPSEQVTNYVDVALGELAEGKPISKAETEAFGCSVKY